MRPTSESDVHLESDIKAARNNTSLGSKHILRRFAATAFVAIAAAIGTGSWVVYVWVWQ